MKTMTKRDLIDRICERRPELRKTDVTNTITTFLDTIGTSLTQDMRVELRDFGVFTPKDRKARVARNPKTGAPVEVKATKVCGFKVGKALKTRLAESYKPSAE
jgi:integration host factor subunit beta